MKWMWKWGLPHSLFRRENFKYLGSASRVVGTWWWCHTSQWSGMYEKVACLWTCAIRRYHLNLKISFTKWWLDRPCRMSLSVGPSRNHIFKKCMFWRWRCRDECVGILKVTRLGWGNPEKVGVPLWRAKWGKRDWDGYDMCRKTALTPQYRGGARGDYKEYAQG